MAILLSIILVIVGEDVTTLYNCQVGAVPRSTPHHRLTNLDSQAATTLQLVSTISNDPPALPLQKKHLARSCLLVSRSSLTWPSLPLHSWSCFACTFTSTPLSRRHLPETVTHGCHQYRHLGKKQSYFWDRNQLMVEQCRVLHSMQVPDPDPRRYKKSLVFAV